MTIRTGWVKWRSATDAEWATVNPVVPMRAIAVSTDSARVKFGDGHPLWADLDYSGGGEGGGGLSEGEIQDLIDASIVPLTEADSALASDIALKVDLETPVLFIGGTPATETLNDLVGTAGIINPFAHDLVLDFLDVRTVTAHTGAILAYDLLLDGVTVFTDQDKRARIVSGARRDQSDTPDITAWPPGGVLTVNRTYLSEPTTHAAGDVVLIAAHHESN